MSESGVNADFFPGPTSPSPWRPLKVPAVATFTAEAFEVETAPAQKELGLPPLRKKPLTEAQGWELGGAAEKALLPPGPQD